MAQGGVSQNLDLFGPTPIFAHARYDGPEYVPERDQARLTSQTERIFQLMRDALWRTLPEIAKATGDPPASISAQLRHLRKPRFGAHTIERRSRKGALFEYRLVVNQTKGPVDAGPSNSTCVRTVKTLAHADQIVTRGL